MKSKNVSKKFRNSYFLILITIILPFLIFSHQNVFAIPPVWFAPGSFNLNDGGVLGGGVATSAVGVTVTDLTKIGAGTITVRITSSVDTVGFDLTLIEGAPGEFSSTNLALMRDNGIASMSSRITIIIFDDSSPNPSVQTLGGLPVLVISDSDTGPGLTPTFIETGPDTNLYTATIKFGQTTDSSTNTLAAAPGNIYTIADTGGGNWANGFIIPNQNQGKGAILAEVGGTVTATYESDSSFFVVGVDPGPGRGSGGLISPGLVVDSPNGGGCNDCLPPTLGIDRDLNRLVKGGFSYNNNPVDVDLFYTSYPLITVDIGQQNEAVLKVYDDGGVESIEHIELAFGLAHGESFSNNKASISFDKTFDGIERTTVYDPENVLENVKISTSIDVCDIFSTNECLIVSIQHTFREELEFNMVATNVWDFKKNSWQNFYNHGIEIIGESKNQAKTKMIALGEKEMRGLYELTQIDKKKHLWVDEFGNIYEHHGNDFFEKIYSVPKQIVYDELTSHGCNRECNWFTEYKMIQELSAEIILNQMLNGKSLQSKLGESFSYTYNPKIRSEDLELQKSIILEQLKAEQLAKTLYYKRYT